MQTNQVEVVREILKGEIWLASQVTAEILDLNLIIHDVGRFYNDAVKYLMQRLLMLGLSPYWLKRPT